MSVAPVVDESPNRSASVPLMAVSASAVSRPRELAPGVKERPSKRSSRESMGLVRGAEEGEEGRGYVTVSVGEEVPEGSMPVREMLMGRVD